jgi:O-antigen/teichoic acid export membrane protein
MDHHRRERERRVWLTAKAGLLARAVGYGVRLAVIPLSLKLLGTEKYGLWLTVGSLITWLRMSDFGLSPGLVNALASASGRNDRLEMRRLVSSGFFAFAVIGLIVLATTVGLSQWSGIRTMLGISDRPDLWRDASLLVLISGAFLALSMPLNTVASVALALQEGYLSAWSDILANIFNLSLLATLFLVGATLPMFAIGMSVPGLIGTALLAIYIFASRHPDLAPSPRFCDRASLRTVWRYGGPLALSQIAELSLFYSTNILIANRLGPASVPAYAIPLAMFMVVHSVAFSLIAPNLPAYAEASQRGDWTWVRKTVWRSFALANAIMVCGNLLFLVLGRAIIRWWAGPDVVPEWPLLVAFCVYFQLLTSMATAALILTGLGLVKLKAILHCIFGLSSVLLTWFLLPLFGVSAPLLAGVVPLLAYVLVSAKYTSRLIGQDQTSARGTVSA